GTLFTLKEIRKRTRDVGAWLVIDGTQSVGALPFSVEEIEPDALICAGYKWLLGPYSMGLAYYGPAMDDGIPVEENWINRYESENFAGLVNYNDQYQPYALRYEVGEHSNFILIPMQLTALQQINEWGVGNIQDYCRNLISDILDPIKENGFGIEDEEFRGSHLLGIRLRNDHNLQKIQARMKAENILVSFRGRSIRVSPNVYNTKEDLARFIETLMSSV
ncbi:MAG TPA: aminotransferase class V-fold PLP-dependent enzyme, partial [Halalkalibaculum sp.]|nr:aminotransferase class V-fold PLP-dependent enzyme [Halalkalibaculum sp.]